MTLFDEISAEKAARAKAKADADAQAKADADKAKADADAAAEKKARDLAREEARKVVDETFPPEDETPPKKEAKS